MTSARWPLFAILVAGFTLRLAAVVSFKGTIDPEGSEYARIAENLLAAHGYVGIATPGAQLLFPPFFPFAIAATSLLTGHAELAGRVVSLLMGTLLVLAVYLLARHLYDQSTGYVAALLVAVHPYLIGFSSTVYCETTYMALVLPGTYVSFRSLRAPSTRAFVLAGVFFGLAYLTRPEAVLYSLIAFSMTVIYALLTDLRTLRQVATRAIWQPAIVVALALPYVFWLHAQTGEWRLEGKTPNNYAGARLMLAGANLEEAAFGVAPDLTERGARIASNLSVMQATPFSAADLWLYLRGRTKVLLKYLLEVPSLDGFGSPPLCFLALYGLFSKPWSRELAANQLFLLVALAITSTTLLFAFFLTDRFLLLFVPILTVWAAQGIGELARWATATLQVLRGGRSFVRIEPVFVLILAATVPLVALPAAAHMHRANGNSQPVRKAGEWLNAHAPGTKMVADTVTFLAFHAAATFVPLPYADSDVALRYLDKRGVNFVVLSDHSRDHSPRPYLDEWTTRGVPSPRAKLIYDVQEPRNGRIRIYELAPIGRASKHCDRPSDCEIPQSLRWPPARSR